MARAARRTGLNQNLQFGMWLFEGMKVYGIDILNNKDKIIKNREVQFPSQTLAYKSGTVLDAGLLYAAALEAAGIRSAFIPLEDDFITLIGLGITEAGAATLFNGTNKILIINDEVWLPLSMGALGGGFTAAWDRAAGTLNTIFENTGTAELVAPEDAWWNYPPAAFPALGVRIGQPDLTEVRRDADTALNAYITSEINPLIQAVQRQIQSKASGSPLAGLYNRLGILQVRAGRAAEAKTSYERAAGMGSVPAMTNRGNLALNENDIPAAERWFRQALQAQPGNATALRGLEQVAGSR
jgi:tetratricopeptide (TPR) repeat protein